MHLMSVLLGGAIAVLQENLDTLRIYMRMRIRSLSTVACIAMAFAAPKGPGHPPEPGLRPDIEVEDDVLVGGRLPLPYTEPHLAADPDDPDHLLVAAIVGFTREPDRRSWRCATMLSRDGGRSWDERRLNLGRCADPWLILEGDHAWFSSLHDLGEGSRALAVHRSMDGGATWDANPVFIGRGHDHPSMVSNPGGGVYVVANYLSRRVSSVSLFPLDVPGLPAERLLERTDAVANTLEPVITREGTVVVPFAEFSRFVQARQERIEPPRTGVVRFRAATGRFSDVFPITRRCGSRKGFAGTAIDTSGGRFDQRVYLACISVRGGDILVFASDDGGTTWRAPVPVLGIPDPAVEGTALRRAVGIAVGPAGTVGVVWQDRGADPERRCQVQRFAASLDGGASFSRPVDLSSAPSCPDTPRNRVAARQWPAGTDYGSIVGISEGRFRAVWADARSGIYQIRMATVSVH